LQKPSNVVHDAPTSSALFLQLMASFAEAAG
jgi:hypothetical protein